MLQFDKNKVILPKYLTFYFQNNNKFQTNNIYNIYLLAIKQ